jgi:hypothetical protein
MTLARLPFRLGLGRVWTPSFIFRPLRPICILVRTQMLFALCMIWIFVLYIWILDSCSLRGYFIFFCGFHRELVQCCYLDSTRIICMLRRAYFAWWCVSKATSCELWRDCYNSQGADFGASQLCGLSSREGWPDGHGYQVAGAWFHWRLTDVGASSENFSEQAAGTLVGVAMPP